ncbi:hypothetical protein CYL16_21495 [Mycobacterium sp. EPG1]|nr:hypothetical protein CYL16_21495 [Mycobacterium sp. EPG1]
MGTIEDFSRMVSRVYGAATAPDAWGEAMADIRKVFGSLTAALIEIDGGTRAVKSANLSGDAASEYVGYYRKIDYVLAAVEHSPVGLVRGGRELIALQPRSEFDADWMRPHRLNDGLFVRLCGADRTTSFLVAGDCAAEEFDSPDRARLLTNLIPHLQQALRTERSLRAHSVSHETLHMMIDCVEHGIVTLDANSAVMQMNRAAAAMLSARDGLEMCAGAVVATDAATGRRLARALAQALGLTAAAAPGGTSLLCPRPSGRRPYVVHIVPCACDDDRAPCALMVILDPERVPEPPMSVLCRLFGLTRAEALVAARVLRGEGVRAIADEMALSVSTVKTHLQHVFDKTGTHRQAELVRLLLSVSR